MKFRSQAIKFSPEAGEGVFFVGQDAFSFKSQSVDLSDDLSEVVHKSSYLEVIPSRYLVKQIGRAHV